jgi:hypothetical protein
MDYILTSDLFAITIRTILDLISIVLNSGLKPAFSNTGAKRWLITVSGNAGA